MARRDGQIIARGERKWLVHWHLGQDPSTGKYKYKSETIHGTKRDAQTKLNSVLRSRDLGTYVEPARVPLNRYLDKWLETAAKPGVRTRTYEDYRWVLDKYVRPAIGACRLDQLRALDVQDMLSQIGEKGLSPRTIRLAHRVLSMALKQAVRWGMLSTNPAELVDLPKQKKQEMQALSGEEVAEFRKAAKGSRWEIIFDLALATGMRPSEYLALRWKDADMTAGAVTVRRSLARPKGCWEFNETKTARGRRTIPVPTSIVRGLREHRKRQAEQALKMGAHYKRDLDLVFANEVGDPLSARNGWVEFKSIAKKANLPDTLRLYDLRHTTATLLLASGVNVKVVSERLGHASAAMTLDVYAHVLPGMQEEATEKLEAVLFKSS